MIKCFVDYLYYIFVKVHSYKLIIFFIYQNEKFFNIKNKMQLCVSNKNKLWELWEEKSPLPNIKWIDFDPMLVGWSKASLRSNFILKKLKVSFDAGLSCPYLMDHIFLTHGHCDHSAGITFFLLNNRVKEDVKTDIYVPIEITEILQNKIQTDFHLTESRKKKPKSLSYRIVGVEPGMKFQISIKNTPSMVEIFKCYHSVPTVGFGISRISRKIKSIYKNLSNEEKKSLSEKGVSLKDDFEEPFILYLGDTDVRVFDKQLPEEKPYNFLINILYSFLAFIVTLLKYFSKENHTKDITKYPNYQKVDNQDIFKYPIIMVECTFILECDYLKAKEKKHMHWNDLEPIIRSHPNNNFILYHFSKKYTRESIDEFFTLYDKPENCYIWNSP